MATSAPGKHTRKGMSMIEAARLFADEAKAEAMFIDTRWPNGICCPKCGSLNIQTRTTRKPMPYRCRDCRKDFSVKTGTVMQSSKLSFGTWGFAAYLLTTNLKGVSSMKLHRDLDVTYKTAWHLSHRIREALREDGADFAGPVEVDEAYFGGKFINLPKSKRTKGMGRGTKGKAAVAGMVDRKTNQVSATTVPTVGKEDLRDFITQRARLGAVVYTDNWAPYRGIPYDHHSINHSGGEYVRYGENDDIHTNHIESFWATMKRAYIGVYHHMSHKHLHRYVNEFSGRHNIRPLDTIDQLRSIVTGMVGKRLRYKDLVA